MNWVRWYGPIPSTAQVQGYVFATMVLKLLDPTGKPDCILAIHRQLVPAPHLTSSPKLIARTPGVHCSAVKDTYSRYLLLTAGCWKLPGASLMSADPSIAVVLRSAAVSRVVSRAARAVGTGRLRVRGRSRGRRAQPLDPTPASRIPLDLSSVAPHSTLPLCTPLPPFSAPPPYSFTFPYPPSPPPTPLALCGSSTVAAFEATSWRVRSSTCIPGMFGLSC